MLVNEATEQEIAKILKFTGINFTCYRKTFYYNKI